jgi:PAS domain S-box-containing protein
LDDSHAVDEPFRILLIEDDPDALSNLQDILELDGHEITTASSFGEAVTAAIPENVSLVITDRHLPDGMIEDFIPVLKKRLPTAEIIVVTGYGDVQSTIAALRLGVTDYVIKPVFPDDLRAIVNRIAEKRSIQRKLAEEQHFANEVLNTAEAIVLVLELDGRVLKFNRYFQDLTGWTINELRGQDWFETCILEGERETIRSIFIATAHDVHTRGIINKVSGKDGQLHTIRWANTTLKKVDGTIHAVLAVGVDVSDLEEAQARVLHAERLAAIGQTMTALAHESRNALQRMKAAADVLALEIEGNKSAEEDIRVIQRAAGDLEVLLEEVRSFAAPIQIHPVEVDLPCVWQRAWKDILPMRFRRDAKLSEVGECEDVSASVDTIRMEQVFRNLFENSLAACADPVHIELECRSDQDTIEIICRDNGPGLNEEQKRKLFEPFYTTKATGTGLGMSICQRIVEAHGGDISVHPTKLGAGFRILLPRSLRAEYRMNEMDNSLTK